MKKLFSVKVCLFAIGIYLLSGELLGQCSTWPTSLPNTCVNSGVFALTGGSPPLGTYYGAGVTGGANFSPAAAGVGSHTLKYVATASACTDTAYKVIVVVAKPTASMGTLGPFCENQSPVTLNQGTPTAGGTSFYYGTGVSGPAYVFDPSVGPGGSPYTIGYAYTSTTTTCSDSAEVQVTVNGITAASLSGLDTAYCVNSSPQIITPVVAPSGGTLTGPGISGGNFNIGLAGVGNHTIEYYFTNPSNCTDTATLDVHVRALPIVSITIPNAIKFSCAFDGAFNITGGLPGGGKYVGDVGPIPGTDSVTGIFTPDTTLIGWNVITYKYNDGLCQGEAMDSILVNENPEVTLLEFPKRCANGTSFQLNQAYVSPYNTTATFSGNGVTGIPGAWFFDPVIAGAGTHAITYCYTGPNGCQTCRTQNIVVNPVPSVTFNDIINICENAGPIDLQPYGQPIGGYFSGPGVWTDSITWKPNSLPGAGTYQLTYTYTDTNGCSAFKQKQVPTYPKPKIQLSSTRPAVIYPNPSDSSIVNVSICLGDSVFPTASSKPAAGFVYLPWLNAIDLPPIAFFPPDDFQYQVIGTTTNLCRDTGLFNVHVIQPASADITGDSSICIGDTTTLTAVGASNYEWVNPVSTTPSISVDPKVNTVYQVIAKSETDGDGKECTRDTTKTMVVVNLLPLVTTGLDTSLFIGDATILKAYGAVSYVWTEPYEDELSCLECPRPEATPIFGSSRPEYRVYYVTGTDINGCMNSDSIRVDINPKTIVFVPSAFSPNGDGINDVLYVESKGIQAIDFEIYDRFGNTVFTSTDPSVGWDGKIEGEFGKKAVYLYRLSAKPYKTSLPINQAGEITLIR